MERTYKISSHHTHVSRPARARGTREDPPQMARRCSHTAGLSARSWFSREPRLLEQHDSDARAASAAATASVCTLACSWRTVWICAVAAAAAAEAPDTHTRGGQPGLGQSGRHDYGCGAGTRARWRLTSVVGCHRVDQESTGAARAPIAPRHIFAGVHFVGGSRMRRPRCTCGMLHCLLSGYVPRGLSRREARLSSGWVA